MRRGKQGIGGGAVGDEEGAPSVGFGVSEVGAVRGERRWREMRRLGVRAALFSFLG